MVCPHGVATRQEDTLIRLHNHATTPSRAFGGFPRSEAATGTHPSAQVSTIRGYPPHHEPTGHQKPMRIVCWGRKQATRGLDLSHPKRPDQPYDLGGWFTLHEEDRATFVGSPPTTCDFARPDNLIEGLGELYPASRRNRLFGSRVSRGRRLAEGGGVRAGSAPQLSGALRTRTCASCSPRWPRLKPPTRDRRPAERRYLSNQLSRRTWLERYPALQGTGATACGGEASGQ